VAAGQPSSRAAGQQGSGGSWAAGQPGSLALAGILSAGQREQETLGLVDPDFADTQPWENLDKLQAGKQGDRLLAAQDLRVSSRLGAALAEMGPCPC